MSEFQRIQANSDSITRQTGINDWEYNSKLSRLFVVQLSFLAILLLCIAGYLAKAGIVPMIFVVYMALAFLGILLYIGITRALRNKQRSPENWNEMDFQRGMLRTPVVSPAEVAAEARRIRELYGQV